MAHTRPRHLKPVFEKSLRWSPSVSLLGMRQVGKTTLMKELVDHYQTFDDDTLVFKANSGNWSFVDAPKGTLGLDECQKAPSVFDRVKLNIDQRKRPGQYVLSGSVRFLSKKQIRESLSGRTDILELFPMGISECHSGEPSRFLPIALKLEGQALLNKIESNARYSRKQVEDGFISGGLPGICFLRDAAVRNAKFRIQIETLLSRDIEMIAPTDVGYAKLKALATGVLKECGSPVNHSRLAKNSGLSAPTVRRLLGALEGLFLIRRHGRCFFGTDTGLTHFLVKEWEPDSRPFLLSTVFMELTRQLSYRYPNLHEFDEFRSRGGIDVPFLIRVQGHAPLAIVPDITEGASNKSLISLTWFKKKFKDAKTIVLHRGNRAYQASSGHLCLPYEMIY